jgi:putative transposase
MANLVNQAAQPSSKKELAKQLGVSRSSLYYPLKLPVKDLVLKTSIEKIMSVHKAYGHRRIALELNMNKKRVRRIMKLFNLKVKRKRKAPKKQGDLGQAPMTIPNLVLGTVIKAQHYIWVSDFTYLPYQDRFIYLATVEDVFTRQVLGWSVSTKHNANLVALALLEAVIANPTPTIIHSDQGSEYRSFNYLNLLKSLNIKPSMSAKASPWQNGYQESFYSGFKLELGQPDIYPTLGELVEAIANQIHYYNHLRIHTALKCPPAIFAQRLAAVQNQQLINQGIVVRQAV